MKVIILAGGLGTRLGRIGEVVPKPMVNIGNKPLLWHIMNIYASHGFKDFIVCLGFRGEVIKSYFYQYEMFNNDFTIDLSSNKVRYHGKHNKMDWDVTLVDTGINTLKGARVKRIENYLNDNTNMLTYGDGVSDVDIQKLLRFHKSHGRHVTITGVRPTARFGELNEKNGRVITFEEKPKHSGMFINGGFIVFNRGLLDCLTENENCDLEVGVLEKLARKGQVMVYKHSGNWECMDNERDIEHLNRLWRENKAFWKIW